MTPAELLALYKNDAAKATSTAREWVRDADWDRVEELLRAPAVDPSLARKVHLDLAWSEEGARQLTRFIARGHAPPRSHLLAAWMAAAHPLGVLEPIVTEHAESVAALGFLAELVSEAAMLGKPLRAARGAPIVQARLAEAKHAYAGLPWVRAPLEAQCEDYLPRYNKDDGSGMGIPFGPRRGPQTAEPVASVPALAPPVPDEATARQAAIEDFHQNAAATGYFQGTVEALSRAALAPLLTREIEEFGEQPPERLYLETIVPELAFGMLVCACLGSVPYMQTRGAAEARRRAWLAMGELAGAGGRDLDTDRIEREVRRCQWAYFDAQTWFIQEYCDLGIAALRADGRSIALVMGTATD